MSAVDDDPFLSFLAAKRARLVAQIADLDGASRLYREGHREPAPVYRHSHAGLPTYSEMIMSVLADHPDGLRSRDILAGVRALGATGVPRTTLSPQITRLGRKGRLINLNGKWALAERSIKVVA